jgi:hypothetical protein
MRLICNRMHDKGASVRTGDALVRRRAFPHAAIERRVTNPQTDQAKGEAGEVPARMLHMTDVPRHEAGDSAAHPHET